MSKQNVSFSKPDGSGSGGPGQIPPGATGAPGSATGLQPAAPAANANPATPEKKPAEKRLKKVRKANPAKVRVKLPPIESYEKELEFSAEGPGRVVVRLERLMGTDRVRILDTRYMTTLLERLEAEEKTGWTKRTRRRKNDERNRFRQLAIEGYMEPDPDMQDLYNHPVFRVNRILNRLAKLDNDIGMVPPKKLPPITPCEPLVDGDEGGRIFKTYPGHHSHVMMIAATNAEKARELESAEGTILSDAEEEPEFMFKRPGAAAGAASETNNDMEEEYLDYEGGEEEEGEENGTTVARSNAARTGSGSTDSKGRDSMDSVKKRYGVAEDENLEDLWQPYHSALVDLLYLEESDQSAAMYEISKAILGVYKRENMVADDFCVKLNRML